VYGSWSRQVLHGIRTTLNEEGFIEVETPILSPLAGGAVAEPFVTRHGTGPKAPALNLRIAPELFLKQCLVGGLDRVYEVRRPLAHRCHRWG
jgi:lysyl-tRNA synthetase class 2